MPRDKWKNIFKVVEKKKKPKNDNKKNFQPILLYPTLTFFKKGSKTSSDIEMLSKFTTNDPLTMRTKIKTLLNKSLKASLQKDYQKICASMKKKLRGEDYVRNNARKEICKSW